MLFACAPPHLLSASRCVQAQSLDDRSAPIGLGAPRCCPCRDISVAHVDAPTRMPAAHSTRPVPSPPARPLKGHGEPLPARRLTGRRIATPSIMRPRRDETTCGTLDRSTPAKVSAAQRAPARFTPITIKCESSIDHPTAIRRQFAPSSPCSHGSISSRRGKRPPSAEVDPENETVG